MVRPYVEKSTQRETLFTELIKNLKRFQEELEEISGRAWRSFNHNKAFLPGYWNQKLEWQALGILKSEVSLKIW